MLYKSHNMELQRSSVSVVKLIFPFLTSSDHILDYIILKEKKRSPLILEPSVCLQGDRHVTGSERGALGSMNGKNYFYEHEILLGGPWLLTYIKK